jgi:hypothetical protein
VTLGKKESESVKIWIKFGEKKWSRKLKGEK